MVLTEDQLNALIRWYNRTTYVGERVAPFAYEQYFHDNGLIEPVYDFVHVDGGTTQRKGYILSKKAKEIVKRRQPLRLTIDLMARIGGSLSVDDMAAVVRRIPFAELPELIACDDAYIRELAERKLRKRRFLASMR